MPDGRPPDDHPTGDDIFQQALDLPPSERQAFLDDACGDDADQRREIEDLLAIADARPDLLVPPEIGLIPECLGKYRLVRECGRGGMGIVFEALDEQLMRTVALKVLPRYMDQDARSHDRFTREAQILARLNHPHIATLYSLESCDGFNFLAMEFVPGVTLADVLAERTLSVDETLSLGWQVAMALESAHAEGVCHCDLKPANIMLGPDGKVSLLDFGIARAFQQVMADSSVPLLQVSAGTLSVGTPGYMAPEQRDAGTVNERSDVWAFGATMYECLTGHRLDEEVVAKGSWRRSLPSGTPRGLADLLGDCLRIDASERVASAAAIRRRFDKLRRPSRWGRRTIGPAVGVLALVVAMAVWFARGPEGPVDRLEPGASANVINAFNAEGDLLWNRRLDGDIRARLVVRSTSGDVAACVVVTNHGINQTPIQGLSPETGEILWVGEPEWTKPVNASGPAFYRWHVTHPWPGADDQVIISGIRDGLWYGFAVEARDHGGTVLGTYHHPGPLWIMQPPPDTDLPRDEVILHGVNSSARFHPGLTPFETEYHPGCVVKLRLPDMAGQAFPWSENMPETRDWPGMRRAGEAAYLAIPMIRPGLGSKVSAVSILQSGDDVTGFSAQVDDGRMVFLDKDLFPVKCVPVSGDPADEMAHAGQLPPLPYLYIRDGVMQWVDVPHEH